MKEKPTRKELICSAISITLLMTLLPMAEKIRVYAPESISKIVAGFILGTIGTFGYAVSVHIVRAATSGNLLASIDENKWTRPFSVLLFVFILLMGLLSWYVSWEGKTGIYYGIGVLFGGCLMESGAGSIIKLGK